MSSLLVPALPSPGSDSGSLVFEDGISSDGVPSPDEPTLHMSIAPHTAASFDGAKGAASAGLDLHSPSPIFVGTPFATGPTPLFEYPFPATPTTRPSLSNASSLSSVSSLHGPPSPSTRFKQHPLARLSSKSGLNQPARRRFSGGNGGPPPIRVPPRLRTDSSSSVASSVVEVEPVPSTSVSLPGPSNNSPPLHTSPLERLRDRSGSLGVLPIRLPPPIITSVRPIGQLNDSNRPPASPAFVGAMASPRFASLRSPLRRTISEADDIEVDERPSGEWRRASMPHIFGSRDEPENELDDIDTPVSCVSRVQDERVEEKVEDGETVSSLLDT